MPDQFIVYKKFRIKEDALKLQELLEEKNISSELGESTAPVDITFSNQKIDQVFEVRIEGAQFENADKLLKELSEELFSQIDPDYYLFDFTDEELKDILTKPDEWGDLDQHLAVKLLKDRGKGVSQEEIEQWRSERLKVLAQPDKDQKSWIFFGYVFAIFGGLIGLLIGYSMRKAKKVLPNGQQVF
ncbi:MAG: hypothetical protein ACPGWM_05260, partial [Flavobacteriales bacterium]